MERSQSFQGDLYPTLNRQLIEGGAVPAMGSIPRNADGDNPRQQTPHQPTANYPSGPSPFPTTGNSYTYSFRSEENRDSNRPGSMPVHSHPPTTPSYQYNPQTELRNQWNGLGRREGLLSGVDLVSHSVASRNQGFPGAVIPPRAVGGHHFDHVPGHWFRVHEQAPGSSEYIFALHGGFNGFTSSQDILPSNSNASTSGGGRHENQLQTVNEFAMPVPRPSHRNDPGLGLYSAANTTFIPEGLPWRDYHNPYAAAGSNRWQQHAGRIPASSGLSGGITDGPEYAEPLYPNSPNDQWTGEGRHPAAVPSNFHSDRVPGKPTRAQRSGKSRETKQGTGKDKVAPRRKRTPKRKPCDFPDSANQLSQFPGTSAVTHGSTRLIPVPQTWYNPTAKQDDWEEVAPIEFGSIKLTDAANQTWTGPHDYESKVLNYKGVGTTISCRINFSGREIGKLKIPTTNHKIPREPITKRKLASEVAKLVKRCIEDIKDEPGCADITFENLVLVRLFRVSKASWQPELWYEDPASRRIPVALVV